MWNVVAVFAGMMVGAVVNMTIIALSGMLYPAPADADLADPAQLNAWVATLPTSAFLLVIVAHLGQAFVGGGVAAGLAKERPLVPALIVGGLSMVGGVMNMLAMPAPTWMWVEMPLYLVAAWGAAALVQRARAE